MAPSALIGSLTIPTLGPKSHLWLSPACAIATPLDFASCHRFRQRSIVIISFAMLHGSMRFEHDVSPNDHARQFRLVLDFAGAGRPAKLKIRLKVALLPRDPSVPGMPEWVCNTPSISRTPRPRCATARWPTPISNLSIAEAGLCMNGTRSRSASRKSSSSHGTIRCFFCRPTAVRRRVGLSDFDFSQLVYSAKVPAYVECALDIALMPTTAGLMLKSRSFTSRNRISTFGPDGKSR